MTLFTERARAKINLTLKVLGRRADGFHELESLVAFASAGDAVSLDTAALVAVETVGPFGHSITSENLVLVTLDCLRAASPNVQLGAVRLVKNLPIAAGIGGGSSDAAAVLRAIRHANPELQFDWMAFAAQLGADVPVCFHDGPALMRGVGEKLEPIGALPPLYAVLANPMTPVPADKTARVFAALAAPALCETTPDLSHRSFAGRDPLLAFMRETSNDLTPAAKKIVPEIARVLTALAQCARAEYVALSGGGPTCFAIFPDEATASAAAAGLNSSHPAWWVVPTILA